MLVCVFPGVVYQSQGLQENAALVQEAGVVAGWGPCHKLEKKGDSMVARLGVIL